MKRILFLLLLPGLLGIPVRAAEVSGAVALTFEGYDPQTADTLEELGVRGTFFLSDAAPEAAQRLLGGGHEIGLDLAGEADMTGLSRRQIYGMLCALQEAIPEKSRPVWVRPPGKWGDGFRQVTQATRLSLLRWSLDARRGLTDVMIDQIRSGDVIALGQMSPEELSNLIGILRSRDLEIVTVSQLAREMDADILPGRLYKKFPVQRTGNL